MRFESQYELVAKKLQLLNESSDRIIKVGKVDGSAEKALSSRFSIKGYPVFFLIDGWTVRQFEGQRSVDALVKFSAEEYTDVEPIPFINSPFGPMGQLRSILMSMGTKILDMYEYLVEEKSLTPAIASIFMGGVGVMAGVIVIITVGLLLEPKPKVDWLGSLSVVGVVEYSTLVTNIEDQLALFTNCEIGFAYYILTL